MEYEECLCINVWEISVRSNFINLLHLVYWYRLRFSVKMKKIIKWRNLRSKIYHLRARKQWLSWELNMWKISYLVSLDIFCFCAWSKMEHNILIREIKYANLVSNMAKNKYFFFGQILISQKMVSEYYLLFWWWYLIYANLKW